MVIADTMRDNGTGFANASAHYKRLDVVHHLLTDPEPPMRQPETF